jgi:HEAT repeat protein
VHNDESTLPDDVDDTLVVAGYRDDGTLDAFIVEHLGDVAPRRRVLALRAARRRGIVTDEIWRAALTDVDADVRRDALTLVATPPLANPSLADVLINALGDDDALDVDGAAFALGEHLTVRAVERLVHVATHHDDARCRESAIAALGAIGDDRARPAIIGALDDRPAVRRRAIVALANFEGPDIDAALARAAQDRDWQVRAAVDQLGRDED